MIQANDSDIGEHLPALFFHAVMARPRLIVELGTRGGKSTRALLAAAAFLKTCRVLSVDIENCSGAVQDPELLPFWHFERLESVAFAPLFSGWCRARGYAPQPGVIFVDTSHTFGQTRAEIHAWMPYLADGGVAMFHDTNCSVDIQRGVIRALEEYFGLEVDERRGFAVPVDDGPGARARWVLLHYPGCNGLTVVRRS